ncbi:MAG: MFS transporter [Candidatus Omnitrophica bacterium]|nr:MFS transporter [Candidatus Omnitrophota bacterium]
MRRGNFIILCLEAAVMAFSVVATTALVPSIAGEFALSQFLTGKVIWIYMLTYGFAALIYGPLTRTFHARRILLTCSLLFSLACLLTAGARTMNTLFAGRFLMGLFGASVIPLSLIYIAHHTESTNRGKSVGLFFSLAFVSSLLGLILSGVIYWRFIYLIPGIAGILFWPLAYFYLPNLKIDLGAFRVRYLEALKDRRIISIFTYIFIVSLIYHGTQQWLGVYFSTEYALSQFLISILITLTVLSGIFGEAIGGFYADKIGRVKTVSLGLLFMILSITLLALKLPFLILAVVMLLWGLGWTFNHSGTSTMLTDLPEEYVNEAASLNSSVRFIAGGAGAGLGGILMQKGFAFGFTVFLVCLFLLLLFSKRLLVNRN